MVFSALKSGILGVWNNKRMVTIFYLANLLLALLIMLPVRAALVSFVGNSLKGESLAGPVQMDFLFEFIFNNSHLGVTVLSMLVVAGGLYWMILAYLSGGAFTVFTGEEKYKPAVFWGGAARFFGRFLRLGFFCALLFIPLYLTQYVVDLLVWLFWGSDPYESVMYWAHWTQLGMRAVMISVVFMIYDYARIYTVLNNETRMVRAMRNALGFVRRNFRRAFTLAFTFYLLGGGWLLFYNLVADLFTSPHIWHVGLLILWQQLYMGARQGLRLGLYAGEVRLYRHVDADTTPAPFRGKVFI